MVQINRLTLLVVILIGGSGYIKAQQNADTLYSELKFDRIQIDTGNILYGKPFTFRFSYTNVGNKPLKVTKVYSICSCVEATFSEDPVMPGKKGYISCTYDALRLGRFSKSIIVESNTRDSRTVPCQIVIKGTVVKNKS